MKRFFAALLALTCMLSLSACRVEQAAAKPVIYLYPEEETAVTVKLDYAGALTCTYPTYGDGWAVTACPDGTLTDDAGQTYSYLYWEGTDTIAYDFSQGFCVAGTDTAAFLEDALAQLGLTRREANEFIVYWLPQMQENPYNLIAFQSDRYTQAAKLTIDPPRTPCCGYSWRGSLWTSSWRYPLRALLPRSAPALRRWSGAAAGYVDCFFRRFRGFFSRNWPKIVKNQRDFFPKKSGNALAIYHKVCYLNTY